MKSHSVYTQTEARGTADAHLNTEVNMADVDFVAEAGDEETEGSAGRTMVKAYFHTFKEFKRKVRMYFIYKY